MPIFRWGQNWPGFPDLEREVDRLLQGMNLSIHHMRSGRRFPQLNVCELEDCYLVVAEIPGCDPKELEVTTTGGMLTIRGVRKPPAEVREDSFRRQERFHGPWQRVVQIPDRVNEEEMSADYSAGVLKIRLPRAASSAPRQIKVSES
ncbi:MAG: Hsp20/alpha crystallin family protein [Planctomycetaceae bacterium]|nr:Hsp20/alpha crystallin family protein [Planctomycetaceae bacterium]